MDFDYISKKISYSMSGLDSNQRIGFLAIMFAKMLYILYLNKYLNKQNIDEIVKDIYDIIN